MVPKMTRLDPTVPGHLRGVVLVPAEPANVAEWGYTALKRKRAENARGTGSTGITAAPTKYSQGLGLFVLFFNWLFTR